MSGVGSVSSSQGSVPFAGLDSPGRITVNLVIVQPNGRGEGFGHTQSGKCVRFHGETKEMIALFHELRAAGRAPGAAPVVVNATAWKGVNGIDAADCPIHSLPEIPSGSAVAFAPY